MGEILTTTVRDLMAQSGVAFGTSGARGEVVAMTDQICFAYTSGFLQFLRGQGEFASGGRVALAGDLRPSTPRILRACANAIRSLGGEPVFCGYVPTPALAFYAFAQGIPSLMVTGSHIPDDRNGIKFYRCAGEVLKEDEAGITGQTVTLDPVLFGEDEQLQAPTPLPPVIDVTEDYVARYANFFGAGALAGLKIGVYQHSAVGRDVLVRIVEALGGTALVLGRSGQFIPVDTEAVRPEDIAAARQWAAEHGTDAIISTDGDSDRPLLANEAGEWLRGDRLGILCAQVLKADQVVTPVSSNTALEMTGQFAGVSRTRIGSPYVIAAMNAALAAGGTRVCGYEANGGFLLGSDILSDGRVLTALPTRDAVLPILAALVASRGVGGLTALEAGLPARVTYSDRIQAFPLDDSKRLFAHLQDDDAAVRDARLASYFAGPHGGLVGVDLTDGIRMTMADGVVVHLRGSGNAPELRCYTEANDAITAVQANARALGIVSERVLGIARSVDGQLSASVAK
jgi:phosphomannomutase